MPREQTKRSTKLIAGIATAVTILSGIPAVMAFSPRIQVSASDAIDPSEPYSSRFTVTNANNFMALRMVSIEVAPISVPIGNGGRATTSLTDPRGFSTPAWQSHRLEADEKITIVPSDLFGNGKPINLGTSDYRGTDIAIVVAYQPWILPVPQRKPFRFQARQYGDRWFWMEAPMK